MAGFLHAQLCDFSKSEKARGQSANGEGWGAGLRGQSFGLVSLLPNCANKLQNIQRLPWRPAWHEGQYADSRLHIHHLHFEIKYVMLDRVARHNALQQVLG